MPKISKDFPDQLSISVPTELRYQLIAIAYFMGAGGEYATPARNILSRGVSEFIAGLGPLDKARYENMLSGVRIAQAGRRNRA